MARHVIAGPLPRLLVVLLVVAAGHASPAAAAPGPGSARAGVSAAALAQVMRLEAVRLEALRADLAGLAVERRTIRLGRWVVGRLRAVPQPSWLRRAELASARLLARHAAGARAIPVVAPDAPALARAMLRQVARGAAPLVRRDAVLDERMAALEAAAALVARERAATREEHARAAWRLAQLAWWRAERLPERLAAGPAPPAEPRGLGRGDGIGHGLARSCIGGDGRGSGGC